ncbi:MAG: glutamate decarboxylase [Bacillota bacterium]|nr:glutamate decarboxylase [Bacillota bacterium]
MSRSRTATEVWKVVYIAPHRAGAEAAREALVGEGFMVMVRPVQTAGSGRPCFEVLVLKSEAMEATRILQGLLGRIYGCDEAWDA